MGFFRDFLEVFPLHIPLCVLYVSFPSDLNGLRVSGETPLTLSLIFLSNSCVYTRLETGKIPVGDHLTYLQVFLLYIKKVFFRSYDFTVVQKGEDLRQSTIYRTMVVSFTDHTGGVVSGPVSSQTMVDTGWTRPGHPSSLVRWYL